MIFTRRPSLTIINGSWKVLPSTMLKVKKVFSWQDNGGVVRQYMVVSWSPDSQRVILLDHFPRGAMLFAAQLVNGIWQSVPTDMNLNALELRYFAYPKTSLINRISVLDWISVTAFKMEDQFMIDDLPNPLFHWETATETLQFTNDALRAVNEFQSAWNLVKCR